MQYKDSSAGAKAILTGDFLISMVGKEVITACIIRTSVLYIISKGVTAWHATFFM